jgi:hypothetical protein
MALVCPGALLMPEIVAELPSPTCYHLFPGPRLEESQQLDPDPYSLARATRASVARREAQVTRAAAPRSTLTTSSGGPARAASNMAQLSATRSLTDGAFYKICRRTRRPAESLKTYVLSCEKRIYGVGFPPPRIPIFIKDHYSSRYEQGI